MAEPVTRAQAKASGGAYYFTGLPCKNGHVEKRLTANGTCVECAREQKRAAIAVDPTPNRARVRAWRVANPAKTAAASRRFRTNNPDAARAAQKKYRAKVADKIKADNSNWWRSNPIKVAAYNSQHRARKYDQRCKCCTPADFEAVYARAVPFVHEVDHIVPLALGGLHCAKNLQVLTVEDHRLKTARDYIDIATARRKHSEPA